MTTTMSAIDYKALHGQMAERLAALGRDLSPQQWLASDLTGALDAAVRTRTPLTAPAKAAKDLRLVATDLDWSHGPESAADVHGPAESLLLALCGRHVGLADLQGEGVGELNARISR